VYRTRFFLKERLRGLGHGEGMAEEGTVKKVFTATTEGKRPVAKPRKKWLDHVENGLNKISVRGWRKITEDKDGWKLILNEAMVLHGP
jgi:hypothetical protein